VKFGYWADLKGLQLSENNTTWIQAMPLGTYQHPIWGEIKFTEKRSKRFADNVNNNVVGTELDIDYEHKARTGEAAGWIKQAESRGSAGLHVLVEFTADAATAIHAGKWRYFSPEYDDKWTHPKTQVEHEDVLRGGGLTNRPFLKDILPVNLSELSFAIPGDDHKEEGVTPKELREALGLAETATDDEVRAKLQELKPKDPPKPPTNAPPTPPTPPAQPPVDTAALLDEMKKLAEGNPALKALADLVSAQGTQLVEMQKLMKVEAVNRKLEAVDKGKVVLAPAAKDAFRSILLGENIADQTEAFLKLLAEGSALVETGERGGGDPTKLAESDAEKKFDAAVEKLMADKKMDYASAATQVARDDPKLFDEVREASTAFKI
jgi:hypothetical protein